MDRNQKRKTVLTVCFIVVCGLISVGLRFGMQNKGQIVLEKQTEEYSAKSETETDGVLLQETAGRAESGLEDEENVSVPEEGQTELLYVHLCGAVVTEGVYSLPRGSRLAAAVEAAGGFAETADRSYHNLAAVLLDGQKVYIPTKEETAQLSVTERLGKQTGRTDENDGMQSGLAEAGQKVNLNRATKEELMTLPGIGEAKAESILLYRERIGPFQSIEELKQVSGIGEAMFERVKAAIVVE